MVRTLKDVSVSLLQSQRSRLRAALGVTLCGALLSTLAVTHAAAAADAAADTGDSGGGLEEVVVTAEKFTSTVQDTPISISALTGEQLQAAGITSVEDLVHDIPGLSMRSAGPGLTEYEARGLASNGGAAPTVGFYLDEIPLSPPALSQSGKVVIDPDLYDVDRIEVLRGPQGTLYGSGSMGGTVKVITTPPKLNTWEGSAQADLSGTDGGGANGGLSFAFNAPIGDMIAVRVVGSDQYRSGWINDVTLNPFPLPLFAPGPVAGSEVRASSYGDLLSAPVTNVIHDANTETLDNARVTVLIQPKEGMSVSLFYMEQHLGMGGYDLLDSTPTTSTLPGPVYDAHYEAFPLREGVHDDVQIFGLTGHLDVGFADLTSATSYFNREARQTEDASTSLFYSNVPSAPTPPGYYCAAPAAGSACPQAPLPGTYPALAAVPYSEVDPSHQFAQELRLTSHDIAGLHYVVGGFYSVLHSVWQEESASAATVPFGIPSGSYFTSWNPYRVIQSAAFADGSYSITDQLKFATGVRWYSYNSDQHEESWGYDAPNAVPGTVTLTQASDKGYNPRFNLSYEPNKNLNLYATASKGFRPGGANQIIPPSTEPPYCTPGTLSFKPDSVWNYELGEKAKLFDNWLTVNGDIYYIKWNGIQQVFTLVCGYQYYNNAGDGRSYGPELEIHAKVTQNWAVTFSGAYTNARITNPTPAFQQYLSQQVSTPSGAPQCPVTGNCTAPILNVPKDTFSAALIYTQPLPADYLLTGRLDDSYVGTSYDVAYFYGEQLPSYSIANFRLILAHGPWSAHFYINNLTNKVALTTANNTSFQFNVPQVVRYSTNQPLTVGMQFNFAF
jgi:iron complex outermembrane receptor protein